MAARVACLLTRRVCGQTTSSIAVLSYLSSNTANLSKVAGIVSAVAAAITAWQEYGGADRKINRYTNANVSLKNVRIR